MIRLFAFFSVIYPPGALAMELLAPGSFPAWTLLTLAASPSMLWLMWLLMFKRVVKHKPNRDEIYELNAKTQGVMMYYQKGKPPMAFVYDRPMPK